MKKVKLLSVIFVLVLLCAFGLGILMTGTTAANGVTEWTVDGTTYATVKAALTAAASEPWAADESLVITVDPAKLASESISHDAGGTAYAGGIAFGQKTIFRADGTRLPITIQGSSDRTAFTLNITKGTKVACANSYTFKNLTFPIGDTSSATHIYAGSGQVAFENVATGSGVLGVFAADNFSARAFDGWADANVTANADKNGNIRTTMAFREGFKYVHKAYECNTCAVKDSDGWTSYEGVSLKPEDTSVELLLDGGMVGYFRGRLGNNPVAESIQRIESGIAASREGATDGGYVTSCGTYNNKTTYADRAQYTGDVTVIFNGGEIQGSVRLLHTAQVNGNFNVEINGGTFLQYFQCGFAENGVSGDFNLDVTGGDFQATKDSNCFYAHPSGRVDGKSTVNISGGTYAALFRGTHGTAYDNSGTAVAHEQIEINVKPNAKGAAYDPVFNGIFYATESSAAVNLTLNISGGTFNQAVCIANKKNITNVQTTVTGGTFNSFFCGGAKNGGVISTIVNNIKGGTFNGFFMGAGVTSDVTKNITNTISGGVFERPVYGGACDAVISGTITNDLSGPAKFNEGFCGVQGTTVKTGSTGAVVNRIYADENGKAPVFLNPPAATFTFNNVEYDIGDTNGFAFLGGTTYGEIIGTVTNTVEAGEFGTSSIGMYQGGNRAGTIGKDENGVSVYNTVKGGTFNFRWYGGCLNDAATGEIRNVIEDGFFYKEAVGGNRTMSAYDSPITTTIRGGEFQNKVLGTYLGYTADQSARGQVSSVVTLNIEGGIFRGDIYGLGDRGAATTTYPTGSGIKEEGSVLVNLYGGTFYGNVYPTNEAPEAESMKGLAQVTVEPKCGDVVLGKKMIPRIDAEKYVLKGGEYKILLDAKGKIEATSAEGEINFEQVDKWKNATYLTLPAGHNATVNVTTAKDAYGYFETVLGESGEVIEVHGAPLKLGASMILTDRIALKFQLSKEAVDAVESFTYSFTLPDGTVLAEGTKADLKEMMEITEFEYYTLTLRSLGIGQFDTPVTANIKGIWENDTFSISTLATAAVTAWEGNDSFVLMAKAIVNMAKAAKGEAVPYLLTPDEVIYERKTPTRDEAALVSFTDKSLLMSSAVGVRLSGTVANAADAEGLVVKVNGGDVTAKAAIRTEVTGVTVDLYFTAYGMSEEFKLEILDKNGKNCLTMYERLDSFATQYGTEHALAYALLSYVQSTSAMTKASFNLTASDAEIEYLNSLYAGETAYYGDLHGHPGGGIIEDGKVDMSVWVADRTTIGVDFYTAMNHKQVAHMYDDGWDDTVLIGGSEPATTVTKGDKKISVHYNMIVPNPEALIEVLQLFPEFNYTGGKDGVEINMGQFGYPKFTYDRFNELVTAIKERGGTVVNVHPKQQYTSDDPLDYYYQDYMGLEVFYSYDDKDIHGKDSQVNYDLWCELLALGKRVWATAGSDSHNSPVNTGLTTLYSTEALNTKYVEKIASGNFAPGYAGIRMAIGDTEMGGHTDFAGKKLIFSVGDIHEKYLSETRAYTVNVITDQGVVYSTVIDGTKTNYFSLDADENAAFYRIEVVDEELQGLPIVGLGNPIWND